MRASANSFLFSFLGRSTEGRKKVDMTCSFMSLWQMSGSHQYGSVFIYKALLSDSLRYLASFEFGAKHADRNLKILTSETFLWGVYGSTCRTPCFSRKILCIHKTLSPCETGAKLNNKQTWKPQIHSTHHQQESSRRRGKVATAWRTGQSWHRTATPGNNTSANRPKKTLTIATMRRWGGSHSSNPESERKSR